MSSLFSISVVSVEDDTVTFHYQVVHPDQWDVPQSLNVGLQTLVDAWWHMLHRYLYGGQPAAVSELETRAAKHPRRADYDRWLEMMHGPKVSITEQEHDALSDGTASSEGLAGWGFSEGEHYKSLPTQYNEFCAAAERVLRNVWLENEDGNPKAVEDDPDPSADLFVQVRDPDLLSHLEPGMHWESALYDFEHYRTVYLNADLDRTIWDDVPDLMSEVCRLQPFEGDDEDGTAEELCFAGDALVVTSQSSEVVVLSTADWTERWRGLRDGFFSRLNVVDGAVTLNDPWGDDEHVAFDLESGGERADIASPRGQLISNTGRYAVDFGDTTGLTFVDDDRFVEQPDVVEAVAFNPDDSLVAVGGMYHEISILDPATGESKFAINVPGRVSSLAFSPDSRFIAACTGSHTLMVYRVEDGEWICRQQSRDFLVSVSWSDDGELLAVNHVGSAQGYGGHIAVHAVPASEGAT